MRSWLMESCSGAKKRRSDKTEQQRRELRKKPNEKSAGTMTKESTSTVVAKVVKNTPPRDHLDYVETRFPTTLYHTRLDLSKAFWTREERAQIGSRSALERSTYFLTRKNTQSIIQHGEMRLNSGIGRRLTCDRCYLRELFRYEALH